MVLFPPLFLFLHQRKWKGKKEVTGAEKEKKLLTTFDHWSLSLYSFLYSTTRTTRSDLVKWTVVLLLFKLSRTTFFFMKETSCHFFHPKKSRRNNSRVWRHWHSTYILDGAVTSYNFQLTQINFYFCDFKLPVKSRHLVLTWVCPTFSFEE